jgi:hypothetical protein
MRSASQLYNLVMNPVRAFNGFRYLNKERKTLSNTNCFDTNCYKPVLLMAYIIYDDGHDKGQESSRKWS